MVLMRFTFLGKWESYSIVQKKRHYPAISTPMKALQGSEPMASKISAAWDISVIRTAPRCELWSVELSFIG